MWALPITIKKNGILSSNGHLWTPQIPIENMAMSYNKNSTRVTFIPTEKLHIGICCLKI